VTSVVDDPTGYGRIVRGKNGEVDAVVEHRDASPEQLQINEINASIYCFRRSLLGPALRMISTDNAQGEMYLTDAVGVLAQAGHRVSPFQISAVEMSGVNDRAQLGAAADELAERIVERHMRSGVTVVQPSSTVIDASVVIEPDVIVHAGAIVGPASHLVDATIGERARVQSSVVRNASVAADAVVGPFENVTA
jgi:bifunctional UDP-N-acetylglucosamine pyrophosphorylase/glucosamine-1-phosphate N-acetyltransferase